MKKFLIIFTVLFALLSFADVTLVKDGKSQSAILLDKKPTQSSQMGAAELNHYINLMTGTKLPVFYGDAPKNLKSVIKITDEKQPKVGEFYSIKFTGKEIILSGNDSKIYDKVVYNDYKTFPNFKYTYNGSLWAVYDFLEDYLNVHFYTPTELGTTFTKRTTLVVKENNRTFAPPLDAFRYVNNDDNRKVTKLKISPRDNALWRLRWRQTSFFGRTNHNTYSIYFAHWGKAKRPGFDKAFKYKRPELFAQGYKGKGGGGDPIIRSNYPGDKDLPSQLCFSNKDTIKYYADEALTYFNGKNVKGGWHNFSTKIDTNKTLIPRLPGKPFFYPYEGGDNGNYCLCKSCQARLQSTTSKENVSNNKFQFVADVANKVAKTDKRVGISTLAYIKTAKYPDKVKLPDNISVQLCLTNYAWWHPIAYKIQHGTYKDWIKKEAKKRPLTLWTYIFGSTWDSSYHFGKYQPFPTFYPWVIGKQFKEFTADGIRGWFTEVEMQYNTLEAYVANKIAFNPNLDPNKVIDQYFDNYYGAAGKVMKEFYKEVEKSFWNPNNAPKEWLKDPNQFVGPKGVKHPYWGTGLISPKLNWEKAGNPQRMKKLKSLLKQAELLVKTPEEKARLKYFKDAIWSIALKGEAEYALFKKRLDAPPQMLGLEKMNDANGDLDKIDWSKAVTTSKWLSLKGTDINSTSKMQVAIDSKYLYLKYSDSLKPFPQRDVWRENIELFFTEKAKNPVYQFSIAPNGLVSSFKYNKKSIKYQMEHYDFKAKVKNSVTKSGWQVELAIPLSSFKMANPTEMLLNFIRTRLEGTAIWSPIFCNAYLDGLDSMGRLGFFPKVVKAKDFTYSLKGKQSDLVNDSEASTGKAGMMKGDYGWAVQCKVPYNFSARYSYDVFLNVRAEVADANSFSNCGVYDSKFRKVIGSRKINIKDINGKTYKKVHLGRFKLSPDMFIYLGGVVPKNANNKLFLDSVEFQLVK